jgi:hypothetical protein
MSDMSDIWNCVIVRNFWVGIGIRIIRKFFITLSADTYTSGVIVNWGSPAPSWILDKSAWISNMTKQGIIVNRIDNRTTIANHTGLVTSDIIHR